jgi:tetratricopeptide (TPR) repeat protein
VLAEVAAERRDGQGAEALAFEAFTSAQRAGADAVAADAGTLLVYAVGVKSGRVDEGERWARLTEALIGRMGGDDRLAVRLSAHRALMLAQGGRTRAAIDEGRRAVRLAEPKAPPVLLAGALHSLAIALRNGGQSEEAAATLERVIDIDRRELGPGHPKEGDALSTLGILFMNEKRYEDARGVWERALPINARIDALAVNDLVMAAETSARLGRFAEAHEHMGRALDTLRRRPDPSHYSFAVAYAVLGDLDRLENKLDDSVADYGTSLDAYARSVGADSPPATPALIGLGFTQLARGKARDARALFERVLSILKDGISPGDAADVRVGLAQAIWQGGADRTGAKAMFEQARAFYAQHPGADRDVLENERLLEAALGGRH